ncbi:MAG: ankyrin repeat domain-containing protein [Gammaproteobacteria bacterium]
MIEHHRSLMAYMQSFGYQPRSTGICYGISAMGIQAILCDEIERFNARLIEMLNDFNGQIKLSHSQRIEKEILAFMDGIEVYANPNRGKDLFESGQKPDYQDIIWTAPILNSLKIEAQGSYVMSGSFSGIYSIENLKSLFHDLRFAIEKHIHSRTPLGLLFKSQGHVSSASYSPGLKQWIYIDANNLPVQFHNDEHSIAEAIMESYKATKLKLVPIIEIFTTKEHEAVSKSITSEWTTGHTWIDTQKLKQENAGYMYEWLLKATIGGHLEIAKTLVKKMVDPDLAFYTKNSPLVLAAEKGHTELVKVFLKTPGVNPNKQNEFGFAAIHIVAIRGDVDTLIALLQCSEIDANQPTIENNSPLTIAAVRGHVEIVRILLDHLKDDPNLDTLTPLRLAKLVGHTEITNIIENYRNGIQSSHSSTRKRKWNQIEKRNDFTPLKNAKLKEQDTIPLVGAQPPNNSRTVHQASNPPMLLRAADDEATPENSEAKDKEELNSIASKLQPRFSWCSIM